MSAEEESSNSSQDDMDEEEVDEPKIELAKDPPLTSKKRKRAEEYDANERQRQRIKREIKRMYGQNADMKKCVGQNSELEAELDSLTLDELKERREDCYIYLLGPEYDVLSTGRSVVSIIGRGMEKITGIPGVSNRVTKDTKLVALVHENLPFDPAQFGPYVEIVATLISHGVNLYHEWTTPSADAKTTNS